METPTISKLAAANPGRADSRTPAPPSGVFVDAITGRHASTSAAELLATRRLIWDKHYGWTYDAWIDDPSKYALAGANGRFSLPALARGLRATAGAASASAAVWLRALPAQAARVQGQLAELQARAQGHVAQPGGQEGQAQQGGQPREGHAGG